MKFTAWINDEEVEITLPSKMEVCPRCGGRGVHDHPAFSGGISPDEFVEDPDFAEDYRRGTYDVCCSECNGRNVVEVPDEDRIKLSKEHTANYEVYLRQLKEDMDYNAAVRAERAFGC